MIELRVLGPAELRGGDGALLHSFFSGPKRLALLAYLVLERPRGFRRRDTLLALFWPERGQRRARNALSNMLYHVRRALGGGIVENRGTEEVGLPEGVLWCDAFAFEEALEAGRIEEALGLYRGDLLKGFHASGASAEFEHWLDAERDRLRRMHRQALEKLAERAEGESEWARAAELWRERAAAEPYSGRAALRLMQALEQAGDRAGALRHARAYERLLEEELGAEPDPEVLRLAERMRAAPESVSAERADAAASEPDARPSVAVLPFADFSGEAENEYFSDGVTEELIGRLAKIRGLHVPARTSSFAFKGENADVRTIGRKLGVGAVLEGSVRRSGEHVRITAQLIDAKSGYHLWSETYDRDLTNIFRVQDEIARAIVDALRVELTGSGGGSTLSRAPSSVDAYDLYLKGRYHYNQRTEASLRKALELFERAVTDDPGYARAYAGLADSYLVLGSGSHGTLPPREALGRAEEYAEKALALDETLADAHVSLGVARMHMWDWEGAEARLQRAVELDPGHAAAHHRRGWMMALRGRFDRALSELRRAEELDPLSLPIKTAIGRVHQFRGEPDNAIAQYRRTLGLDPGFAGAHLALGLAYLDKERFPEGIAALEHARDRTGDTPAATAALAGACATAGERDRAEALLEDLLERARDRYVSPAQIATVYGLLGEADKAFAWFEKACEERCPMLIYAKISPPGGRWESIRSDPRFERLLRRVGLAETGGARIPRLRRC